MFTCPFKTTAGALALQIRLNPTEPPKEMSVRVSRQLIGPLPSKWAGTLYLKIAVVRGGQARVL